MIAAGALVLACGDLPSEPAGSGSLAGQVIVSGPLRRAALAIDQIETRDPAMSIRAHVTDTSTDDEGRFSVDVGSYSGLLLLRATGGSFVDLATGATIRSMIGPISALWPSDGNFPATPPFADTSLNGIAFTGHRSPTREGCLTHKIHTLPDGTRLDTCTRVARITPYRALTALHLRTDGATKSAYATAATAVITPLRVTFSQMTQFSWTRTEVTLP